MCPICVLAKVNILTNSDDRINGFLDLNYKDYSVLIYEVIRVERHVDILVELSGREKLRRKKEVKRR